MSKKNRHELRLADPIELPPSPTRVHWDLARHYYRSHTDPLIEKDVRRAEGGAEQFRKKYRGKDLRKRSLLLKALHEYELLLADPAGRKSSRYFGFRQTLDAMDSIAEKRGNLIDERLTKASTRILFFEIELGKLPRAVQRSLLSDKAFAHFHYFLNRVFLDAMHTLSESEERILSLKSGPSSSMWVAGTEKILSNRTITFKKNQIALPEAIEMISTLKPHDKRSIWKHILKELEQISEVAENEFNAIITNKKISDELRHFKKPYSETVLEYENNERSIEALVASVSGKGFALSKRFYRLKAGYLGVKKLPYVQKYDPIGTDLRLSFEEAKDICRQVLYKTHKDYGIFFDELLAGGQIDVYPKKGKRGGAFMSSDIHLPTFVMLNHTNDFSSLSTLIHETGHAIHSMRSKQQAPLYEHYSITTAETASTLFENILYETLYEAVSDPAVRLMLLHERIQHSISSVCRQIAFFNYELAVHERIRQEGALTREELASMLTKELQRYLGNSIEVTKRDGYSFVHIPHFRYGFYVYTYAYGQLVSSLMAARLRENPAYIEKIDLFLSQGGSDSVENIFRKIGIDPLKKETFDEGLSSLEKDINEFERLLKRRP